MVRQEVLVSGNGRPQVVGSPDRIGLPPPWEPIPFFQAVYMHGLAPQAGCIQGQRHRRQGAALEAKLLMPALVQRKRKLQIDHALGWATLGYLNP